MTLSAESLWHKARINIEQAIGFRDRQDNARFQFWATVGLELLGKSCLCSIHPVFVVNPEDFKSVRIACGNLASDEYKTIIAKTLYERLKLLVEGFDEKAESFCLRMAARRNEELHSAKLPFDGVDLRSWKNQYWRVVKLLCEKQSKTLEDLLGAEEAVAAEKIIANASAALEAAVMGRIRQCGAAFRSGRESSLIVTIKAASKETALLRCEEHDEVYECPGCGGYGVLHGTEVDEEYLDHLPDDLGTAMVKLFCESEEFRCVACNLRLSGIDELGFAGFPEEFETTAYRAYEWEPDYGND